MATVLTIVTHITTLLVILCVVRFVFRAGAGLLPTALLTLFVLVFGTVSVVEAGIAAHSDGFTQGILALFVIAQAILIPITLSAS